MARLIENYEAGNGVRQEFEGNEFPLGSDAKEILQKHDTGVLKNRVLDVAANAPAVDKDKISDFIEVLDKKYAGDKRKLTGKNEINHAYQVALLTALTIGTEDLQHDTLMVALGHDLDEDTNMTAKGIINLTSARIYEGIDALSHHANHQDIYPNSNDKRQFFTDLLKAERKDRELRILTIKTMDQIAVSNDPVTKEELKDTSNKLKRRWNKTTRKKIGEMKLLQSMLLPQEFQQEAPIADILSEGITYAQQKLDESKISKKIGKIFTGLRSRRHPVK